MRKEVFIERLKPLATEARQTNVSARRELELVEPCAYEKLLVRLIFLYAARNTGFDHSLKDEIFQEPRKLFEVVKGSVTCGPAAFFDSMEGLTYTKELASLMRVLHGSLERNVPQGITAETFMSACEELFMHRRKKANGAFYTPEKVAYEIAEVCLEKASGRLYSGRTLSSLLSAGDFSDFKIIDPAMGYGIFLKAALRCASKSVFSLDSLRNFAARCLYGIDIDPVAVEIARLSLRLILKTHVIFNRNFVCRNALTDGETFGDKESLPGDGRYAVAIGNPPFIDSELMTKSHPDLRRYCRNRYRTAAGNWDLSCIFIERAFKFLRKKGVMGYIIPGQLWSVPYAVETRRLILENEPLELWDASRSGWFDAFCYPGVLIAAKNELKKEAKKDAAVIVKRFKACEKSETRMVSAASLEKMPDYNFSPFFHTGGIEWTTAIQNALNVDAVANVSGAFTVGEAYRLVDILQDLPEPGCFDPDKHFKFVNTGTIGQGMTLWGRHPMRYLGKRYINPVIHKDMFRESMPRRCAQSDQPKIIIAGISKRIRCFFDEKGHYAAGKSTVLLTNLTISGKKLEKYLNSDKATEVYRMLFSSLSLQGGYLRIGPPQIRMLPLLL